MRFPLIPFIKIFILIGIFLSFLNTTVSAENSESQYTILFQEKFQETPKAPWQWIRENPQSHRIVEDGLQIKIEPGGLMGGAKDAKNILVRPIPHEANRFTTVVETHHQSQYEQAGLILYGGDDDYVKLVHEHVNGKTGVVLVLETNAQARVINHIPSPAAKTRLVLEKTGNNKFKAYAKKAGDSEKIVEVGNFNFPLDKNTRIGIFTQSGEAGADRWAAFSEFKIAVTK